MGCQDLQLRHLLERYHLSSRTGNAFHLAGPVTAVGYLSLPVVCLEKHPFVTALAASVGRGAVAAAGTAVVVVAEPAVVVDAVVSVVAALAVARTAVSVAAGRAVVVAAGGAAVADVAALPAGSVDISAGPEVVVPAPAGCAAVGWGTVLAVAVVLAVCPVVVYLTGRDSRSGYVS